MYCIYIYIYMRSWLSPAWGLLVSPAEERYQAAESVAKCCTWAGQNDLYIYIYIYI